VHRLVQWATRERLTTAEQSVWLGAALRLLAQAFPETPWDVGAWADCARLLPHVRSVVTRDEAIQSDPGAVAVLLSKAGIYLFCRAESREAAPLMRRALSIDEASYGSEHPNVAIRLNNLAQLLQETNRLGEAEPLMRRALSIDEASYGSEHPRVATDLNNLAQLLQATNRLGEAEPLMRRALSIEEASYGSEHPNVAIGLNNLARLLQATDRADQAAPMLEQALRIFERSLGLDHPNTVIVQRALSLQTRAESR
jgi:tetratricopeptide (TPR) repeat protein